MDKTIGIAARLMLAHGAVRRFIHAAAALLPIVNVLLVTFISYEASQLDWGFRFWAGAAAGAASIATSLLVLYSAFDDSPAKLLERTAGLLASEKRLKGRVETLHRDKAELARRNAELVGHVAELKGGIQAEAAYHDSVRNLIIAIASACDDTSIGTVGETSRTPRLAVSQTLDLICEDRGRLFGMGDEHWTFSVFLLREGRLDLYETRRWSRKSETGPHRSWMPGEGHVGQAFASGKEVSCADAGDPSFAQYTQVSERNFRADDARLYVSYAAVPVRMKETDAPLGILIATSDRKGRFSAGQSQDPVAPSRKTMFLLRYAAMRVASVVTAAGEEDIWTEIDSQGRSE